MTVRGATMDIIGPNPCFECGGGYGEHESRCARGRRATAPREVRHYPLDPGLSEQVLHLPAGADLLGMVAWNPDLAARVIPDQPPVARRFVIRLPGEPGATGVYVGYFTDLAGCHHVFEVA